MCFAFGRGIAYAVSHQSGLSRSNKLFCTPTELCVFWYHTPKDNIFMLENK